MFIYIGLYAFESGKIDFSEFMLAVPPGSSAARLAASSLNSDIRSVAGVWKEMAMCSQRRGPTMSKATTPLLKRFV